MSRKRTTPAIHVCRFRAERIPGKPPRGMRCELSDEDLPYKDGWPQRCRCRAVGGARYAWGTAALCAKHMREETGP